MLKTRPRSHLLVPFLLVAFGLQATAQERKNIVLVAGLKSHGPEGNRIHDYPWSVRLLKTMLENSNIREQVNVGMHFNGWPTDKESLKQADTIMIISDGRDGDIGRDAPHVATGERVQFVDALAKRGCGIVVFHFSTFAPDNLAHFVLDWYGGYFDWETDGKREWYSDIKTIDAEVHLASPQHQILNGVAPFEMREEFYFDIRFRPGDPRWKPIWRVPALPATKPNGTVVSWAVERAGGGRGFGTTCGHFYDNWQDVNFRKTMLNAIAWTAHIAIPTDGVEASFFLREEIAMHLAQPELAGPQISTGDDEEYADDPYWYKPGHPTTPAEATTITTLPGFKAERILTVPEELGSWTALGVDDRGRLIAAAQHRPGLYRVTVPPIEDVGAVTRVEKLGAAATKMGWSHGLLYAFDSLYVTVSEENDETEGGIYRLRDTNGDDQYDEVQQLFELTTAGEHGPHNIVVGPDEASLYLICGNGIELPRGVERRRSVSTDGFDHLMPPGFESSNYTTGGWVCRFKPDGSELELVCSGLRNSYDLVFNRLGDLFTFDSDMEWDLGAPWYRPTRICHLVSGGEFGWRGDAAKWPEYFEDNVAPVVNVGPGSPTGVLYGYGAKFPARYQRAFYALDWTFATIHAVHLKRDGAGYRAEFEEFLGGRGLPLTDAVIGGDGAMYFAVGGRRLGSAVYRVHYAGEEPTSRVETDLESDEHSAALHELRRRLETFHGLETEDAVEVAWPYLGHSDRNIRYAARVAIEAQPVNVWRERALQETDVDAQLTALLALARQGTTVDQGAVISSLNRRDAKGLPHQKLLRLLRVYELTLARGEDEVAGLHDSVRAKIRPLFPATRTTPQWPVNRELSRLLCYLNDMSAIDPILELMASDGGERPVLGTSYFDRNQKYGEAVQDMLQSAPLVERMHHAQMLLWMRDGWTDAQRQRYFALIASATGSSRGGYWYEEFWERIRESAFDQLPEDQREAFETIRRNQNESDIAAENLPKPQGPGRKWTLREALEMVGNNFHRRDFANGELMFSAAQCVTCHRFNGQGSSVGPDLSSIGQRFTLRDILDSMLNPSKAVSDQYRVTMLAMNDGRVLSGRVISRDATAVNLATNLMRPGQAITVAVEEIDELTPVPVSTMPVRLLDSLNEDEVLDLLAYLISGGDPHHSIFGK